VLGLEVRRGGGRTKKDGGSSGLGGAGGSGRAAARGELRWWQREGRSGQATAAVCLVAVLERVWRRPSRIPALRSKERRGAGQRHQRPARTIEGLGLRELASPDPRLTDHLLLVFSGGLTTRSIWRAVNGPGCFWPHHSSRARSRRVEERLAIGCCSAAERLAAKERARTKKKGTAFDGGKIGFHRGCSAKAAAFRAP